MEANVGQEAPGLQQIKRLETKASAAAGLFGLDVAAAVLTFLKKTSIEVAERSKE